MKYFILSTIVLLGGGLIWSFSSQSFDAEKSAFSPTSASIGSAPEVAAKKTVLTRERLDELEVVKVRRLAFKAKEESDSLAAEEEKLMAELIAELIPPEPISDANLTVEQKEIAAMIDRIENGSEDSFTAPAAKQEISHLDEIDMDPEIREQLLTTHGQ